MERRKREAEKRRKPKVPKDAVKSTVGFVIRIHTGRHASDEIKAELKKMNLNHKYDGTFMRLDDDAISKLLPPSLSSFSLLASNQHRWFISSNILQPISRHWMLTWLTAT